MKATLAFNNDPLEAARDLEIAIRYDLYDDTAGKDSHGSNAAALLLRVSEYLRAGQPVPAILASIVATAFEKTAKTKKDREKVLARGLGLAHDNRRQRHHPAAIRGVVLRFLNQGLTETAAVKKAASALEVAPNTVWTPWRKYREAAQAALGYLPWERK